jgi:uncharacterized protein
VIVVLDTNVWISALQFAKHRRTPTRALEKAMSEDVIASCRENRSGDSPGIDRQICLAVHSRPCRAGYSVGAFDSRTAPRDCERMKECRDPNDDMFLECAMRAKADLLIAGDKDLLVLGSHKGTRILTPAEHVVGVG